MQDRITIPCPICGNDITVPIVWETERGEFGTILSQYPVMPSDPAQIERHGTCHCDFFSTLAEAMADHYNNDDWWYGLLDPEPPSEVETESSELTPVQQDILSVQGVLHAIKSGYIVQVTKEEYLGGVRSALLDQAGNWLDEGQNIYAQIAILEVQRLDQLYPFFEEPVQPNPRSEKGVVSMELQLTKKIGLPGNQVVNQWTATLSNDDGDVVFRESRVTPGGALQGIEDKIKLCLKAVDELKKQTV